jgi:transcriptional regulator GlxA family with amidase domain
MGGPARAPDSSAGLNLSLAMIQEDYGAYVTASIGEQLLFSNFGQAQPAPMRFSHEAMNDIG